MEREVVLAGACRTAIGRMGGSLSEISAASLGAVVIKEALSRAKVPAEAVDQVYMGCVLQAGQGQNPARQAAVKAGLPVEVPAVTLNAVCGSGLQSVNLAASLIRAGDADIVVAGGMENMSLAPYLLKKARFGYRMGNDTLVDCMIQDALWDAFHDYHMGITGENIAKRWNISRTEQDEFSVQSQIKALEAQSEGVFAQEIVPLEVKCKKESHIFSMDESPRADATMEKLARLKPAFAQDGVITAANSSSINDGAAAMVVMSAEKARELGVIPMAYWRAGALAGVAPEIMGIGPVAAAQKAMDKIGMKAEDLELAEINEAFAAQVIAVTKELSLNPEILNVNGGAIALGHPVGASGCRILVTLLHEMGRRNAGRGLAALCIGGGMGCAAIVERK